MNKLSESEVKKKLSRLRGWSLDGNKIRKEFQFNDFDGSVEFLRKIAPIADALDHHPDVCIYYNRVIVELSTHDVGGLTELDFQLAEKLDGLV
jgi:4a-hydroxytetrahydrobiopterin dehydratase